MPFGRIPPMASSAAKMISRGVSPSHRTWVVNSLPTAEFSDTPNRAPPRRAGHDRLRSFRRIRDFADWYAVGIAEPAIAECCRSCPFRMTMTTPPALALPRVIARLRCMFRRIVATAASRALRPGKQGNGKLPRRSRLRWARGGNSPVLQRIYAAAATFTGFLGQCRAAALARL